MIVEVFVSFFIDGFYSFLYIGIKILMFKKIRRVLWC